MKDTNDNNRAAIDVALTPTLKSIKASIKESYSAAIARIFEKIDEAGGDLKKAFPVNPNGWNYKQQKAEKAFARQWVKITQHAYGMHDPVLCEKLPITIVEAKIEEIAETESHATLAAYVFKLTAKVAQHFEGEEIEAVTYSGERDPWNTSILAVDFKSGGKGELSTKMIINCSGLGKLFNQFPTRKIS
jgi:hypothetical protein